MIVPSNLPSTLDALKNAVTIDRVGEVLRSVARHLVNADGIAFVLRDGDFCFYVEEDAISPLWKGQRFPLAQCISGWVMSNAEAAVIPDIYADARIPIEAYCNTFVRSVAMVPVGRVYPMAAIGAYWAAYHAADASQLEILGALADSVAMALELDQPATDRQRLSP